jgi:hypothetical protein
VKGDQGDLGPKGDKGDKGSTGQNAAMDSIFVYSGVNQYAGGHSITSFVPVSFELPAVPIAPVGNTWTRNANNIDFSSPQIGYYLITYKIDVRSGGVGSTDAATTLSLSPSTSGPWTQVLGSATLVEAPVDNHIYTISNTVLLNYSIANQFVRLWFWSNDSGTHIGDTALLTGTLPNTPPTSVPEATASLVITRIA